MQILYELDELAIVGTPSGGFVVLSKDDSTKPVWGYSSERLDTANLSPSFLWLMQRINKNLSSGAAKSKKRISRVMPDGLPESVEPLIQTRWDQNSPYNRRCPDNAVTGCVATALAQMVYYYRTPSCAMGSHTYTYNYNGEEHTISEDYSTLPWDFNEMLDEYSYGEYDDIQADNVATLMYVCGVMSNASYGYSTYAGFWSELYNEPLGYNAAEIDADDNLFRKYISEEYPVLYFARSTTNNDWAHVMILDGYNSEGMLHVNFGWGGYCDGYYDLDGKMPDGYNGREFGMVIKTTSHASFDAVSYAYNNKTQFAMAAGNVKTADGKSIFPDVELCANPIIDGVTYNVTEVAESAFRESDITSIIIPDGYTTLGQQAFYYCGNLNEVHLPSTIEEIGYLCFYGASLKDVYCQATTIPHLAEYVFSNLNIGNSTLHVPAEALKAYSSAEGWEDFGHIVAIGEETPPPPTVANYRTEGVQYALDGTTLTATVIQGDEIYSGAVVVPESVEYEGYRYTVEAVADTAFKRMPTLRSVVLPAAIKRIGNDALADCPSLASLTCLSTTPPATGEYLLSGDEPDACTLYVPEGSTGRYRGGVWEAFYRTATVGTTVKDEVQHVYEPAPTHLKFWFKDGTNKVFDMSADIKIEFRGSSLVISGGNSGTRFRLDTLDKLTYEIIPVGIEDVPAAQADVLHRIGGQIILHADDEPLRIRIVNAAGQTLRSMTVAQNTAERLDMSRLPVGVCIIVINDISYKIQNK